MKKFFLGLLAIMVSVTLFAAPRTMEEAAQIAAQFTNQQPRLRMAHKSPRAAANMRLAHKALQNNSEAAAYYVFNQEGNNGFVIVSADDRTSEDVLGYTENGSFDMNTANPNLKWWLERYTKQITALQSKPENAEQPRVRKAVQVTAISNILKNDAGQEIKWSQGTPYNNLCPVDSFDNTRCVTGCVATAASQVMYYYRWPQQGTGYSSYTWDNCTDYEYDEVKHKYNIEECISYTSHTLSANYGQTTYDWNNMKSSYSGSYTQAQGNAVATLMYHAGVASSMEYGGNSVGSGTTTDNMAYGLATYFKYKYTKVIAMYDNIYAVHDDVPFEYNVTANQFKNYFNTELEANRPVIMSGWTAESGGHEFVCCGRDTQNRFYINWGWAGSDNGYFAITSLTPDDCDFSEELDAIIGLLPDNGDTPVDPDPDPVTPGTGAFSLLSNLNNLEAGDEVILVSASKSKAAATISKTSSSSFFTAEDVTINNNTIDLSANSNVVIMTVGKSGDKWTFSNGGQLLVATAAKKVSFDNSGNSGWTISISGGDATIQNQVDGNGRFLYNVTNPRFTTYTSDANTSMLLPQLFYRKAGSATAIDNAEVAPKAVKVLENGQIVIIRDNEKYTIFGQKIQ